MLDETWLDLLEDAPCGLALLAPRGEIVAINRTLLTWLGYTRNEIVGQRRFQELMDVAGKIYYDTHLLPLLRMQGFVNEIAVDLVSKSSARLPVFVSANESRQPSGEPRSIRVAVFQAADRRKYERELLLARRMAEQSLKAKSDFLAMFAHEVLNPLEAVRIAVQLVTTAGVPPAGQRPLSLLQRSLGKVLGLLKAMLEFSQFEAGKATLQRRRFDVRELVQGAVQTLEPITESKQLAVAIDIDPKVPQYLIGDAVKLGQVIANLTGNAVKFTERGSVTVAVQHLARSAGHEAALRFSVSDTGIGIEPDRIERIFDEFAQGSAEISSLYGGKGLGLAISRRIVELYGSKLRVESKLGVGTTFSFVLCLSIADDDLARQPSSSTPE
ncbi:MAG: ATP-binding protein [Polyangiaceae bacterium]